MKLKLHEPKFDVSPRLDLLRWATEHYLEQSQQEFQAYTWVQLLELPSPFSFNEALLLCQHSEEQWVAWIPDYGEIMIHTSQFCQIRA